ncbi:PTS fructose transporter subunit IIC [Endozoicomonas sp. OPT23]|uniref:PTS fructose transporter subunit IIC n=1 Tax=Endozoicomonas sp. OPT23 TaxID=2072845 RepID=UPI00129ADD7A|nr:fructose-specific PTS transporter subunit EIIC [Endozoicomonas sp. OPT23]MRI34649.1 PTS fructose transporter subunit IIC [Endozoicomonas sp. OPT23]
MTTLKAIKKEVAHFRSHLLTGTSHMIPFVSAGGILAALAVMLGYTEGSNANPLYLQAFADIGSAGFKLFIPVLGGYVAWSIANRPGLAPGMIGAWLAAEYGCGFIGAILIGFIAGYIVQTLKQIPLSPSTRSIGAIFLYPLLGSLVTGAVVIFVIGEPISSMMAGLDHWLHALEGGSRTTLGMIMGGMTAFDMGGPVNKVATLFAQTQVNTHPYLMGGVGAAISTPPLGMWLATLLSRKRYSDEELQAGNAALIMGLIGISEGAIPFAAADPLRVIPALVAGGAAACVTGFTFEVINHAPWGGFIVLPIVEGRLGYIAAIIIGSLVTALLVNALKPVTKQP